MMKRRNKPFVQSMYTPLGVSPPNNPKLDQSRGSVKVSARRLRCNSGSVDSVPGRSTTTKRKLDPTMTSGSFLLPLVKGNNEQTALQADALLQLAAVTDQYNNSLSNGFTVH